MSNLVEFCFSDAVSTGLRILLHSVWQIVVLALLFAVAKRALPQLVLGRRQQARLLYVAAFFTLLAMPIAPICTVFFWDGARGDFSPPETTMFPGLVEPMVSHSSESRFLALPNDQVTLAEVRNAVSAPQSNASFQFQATENPLANLLFENYQLVKRWAERNQSGLLVAWIMGAIFFALRPVVGCWQAMRWVNDAQLLTKFDCQNYVAGGLTTNEKVRIAVCERVNVPMVFGWLRPVVLLPVAAIGEMSPQHLELIIRHELAHVRRHDLLANLIQLGIESVLFFHPCMWWISNIVRQEREKCCDDLAIEPGQETTYAMALYGLEKCRQPAVALSSQGGNLFDRIERLLPNPSGKRSRGSFVPSMLECLGPLAILAVVVLVAVLPGQNSVDAFTPVQEKIVEQRLIRENFSKTKLGKRLELELRKLDKVGFSGGVLVAHQGEVILATGVGFNDATDKDPIKPNSLFEIASTTKSFTATAAMLLVQQGKLNLDASIADYLPNVPDSSRSITVRHLLQHQSGIPKDRYGVNNRGLEVAVKTMLGDGPVSAPGSKFEYWNQGYILLSEIIAKAAGESYVDFVKQNIFRPCKMDGTCFNGDKAPTGFEATVGSGSLGLPRSCLEHPYGSYGLSYRGTGGIVTTVLDMWKFHYALQHHQLLSKDSLKQIAQTNNSPYGLGWFVRNSDANGQTLSHGGRVRGFCCEFRRYPASDSCIVILANRDDSPCEMIAGVIEGILFPPKQKRDLEKTEITALEGNYLTEDGRHLLIERKGNKAAYTLYWGGVRNTNAPISFGYVQRDQDGNLVMFQSNEVSRIEVTWSADKQKANKVLFAGKMNFVRNDNLDSGKRDLPKKLKTSEAKKFVGRYDSAVGPSLEIKREQGHLIFKMLWDKEKPNGKSTLGYVMKRSDKAYVLYHPLSPLTFQFELDDDEKKVQQISVSQLNMKFERKTKQKK